MKIRKKLTCPLEITHDILRGKWKTVVVFHLCQGPLSLSSLQASINGISQKMLLEHLNELREWGIVDKIRSEGYPLQVRYYLTARGKRLLDAVEIMQEIGVELLVERGETQLLDERKIPY